ncbi:hypothetical protein I4U23_001212 [Adineta vaga]|nr:hypothetical protein I4U23_001212 [Adineta vaga]
MSSTPPFNTSDNYPDHQKEKLNYHNVMLLFVLTFIFLILCFLFITLCFKQRYRNRVGLQEFPIVHQQQEHNIHSSNPPPYDWYSHSSPPPPYISK